MYGAQFQSLTTFTVSKFFLASKHQRLWDFFSPVFLRFIKVKQSVSHFVCAVGELETSDQLSVFGKHDHIRCFSRKNGGRGEKSRCKNSFFSDGKYKIQVGNCTIDRAIYYLNSPLKETFITLLSGNFIMQEFCPQSSATTFRLKSCKKIKACGRKWGNQSGLLRQTFCRLAVRVFSS